MLHLGIMHPINAVGKEQAFVDAIKILKQNHADVKALFEEVEGLGDRASARRKQIFEEIDKALTVHSQVEETIFYPAFKERAENREERLEVLEAYEEHTNVKKMLTELETTDPKTEEYSARLNVLKELVLHHVKEEEGTMFKMAREMMDREELAQLGERIAQEEEKAGLDVR
ncbi:MAG: hemerythrin domain-containing protein [Candidatus Eremiobacteraeota bacterium]|nr:hemerythrin domain-containing protein [Candidatus Eremiobacteraeota bacterium]